MKTNTVFNFQLMQRALARSDAELGIFRKHYEARAFQLAAKIIAGDYE